MAHDGDAVGLGGDRFLELLDHLLRVPVGEDIAHRGAQIGFGLLGAVVDIVGEHAAGRAAGEEGDLDIFAPLACAIGRGTSGGPAPAAEPAGCTAVQACKSNAAISSTASAAKRTYRERNCIRSSCCLKRFNGARKKTLGSGRKVTDRLYCRLSLNRRQPHHPAHFRAAAPPVTHLARPRQFRHRRCTQFLPQPQPALHERRMLSAPTCGSRRRMPRQCRAANPRLPGTRSAGMPSRTTAVK